jgi:hypothetical protein
MQGEIMTTYYGIENAIFGIENDIRILSGVVSDTVVHKTGDESVGGVKTLAASSAFTLPPMASRIGGFLTSWPTRGRWER